jgi:phosphoribosyl-ATP pyrophosphohydrolase
MNNDASGRLFEAVTLSRNANPTQSRTVQLLHPGRAKMAKRPAEEAIELVIDALHARRAAVVRALEAPRGRTR